MPLKFNVTTETLAKLKHFLILDDHTGVFHWIRQPNRQIAIGDRAGSQAKNGYRIISFSGKHFYEHRLIWLWIKGSIPEKKVVDHINGNPSDNRLENLRLISQSRNTQNIVRSKKRAGPDGIHLPQGVYWLASKGKFVSCIKLDYKKRHLGTFESIEDAHAAYLSAKSEFHPASNIERLI
ncbi:HNH endonuclease signature motif containing protein [Rahnella sp. ChDrAdgB13]|uniref:HNH endonuclease signature motif containing protein n=1 Tax=Rahnella sp. ChDrAdgB13 TaxID=1850581 RepID=UPI001AD85D02|nr:HNH endonuclease signature motif containing protein [Rahnella sp. ChDrAdgB13]